jgi:ribosomal protein S18 acetylase RimI-like enzyme
VAVERGNLAGYLLVVYLFSLEHGGRMAEIDEFFVVPEKRHSKIGVALLEEATRTLVRDGVTQLQLQLGINNAPGKRFYERQGFRQVSDYTLWQKPLV